VAYLRGFARVLGGHYHLLAAMADRGGSYERLARFYITRMLPDHIGLLEQARCGMADLYALTPEDLAQ